MFGRSIQIGLVSVVLCCTGVFAIADDERKPLEGYSCMGLKADKEVNDWVPGSLPKPLGGPDSPPVFSAPTEKSKRLGYNYSPVIVKWPEVEANGFVQIIRLTGEKGWIKKDVLVPYGMVLRKDGSTILTKRRCVPVSTSTGKIGFHFSNG